MKKSIFTIVITCLFLSAQAEEMWHIVGTNDYARKQCVEKIVFLADSTHGAEYYFRNIPQNPGAADLDSLYFMVFDRLTQTGSVMPIGNPDVPGDVGYSAFYRSTWTLNEYPADGGWWVWDDYGTADLQGCYWEESNPIVAGTYMRLLYNLYVQNTFLHIADSLNIRAEERAQVRFVRALTAWYLLDLFPATHFTTDPGLDVNTLMSRNDLYTWLETELKELTTLLPARRTNLYRVDQTAANLLLARLYLNAEVYTGTAQWAKAASRAQQAMNSIYMLHTNGGTYSAYQELFMGDNDVNGAAQEAVLMLKQDGQTAYGYGGALSVIAMSRYPGMPSWCSSAEWHCWRAGYRLLQAFASDNQLASVKGTEFTMPAQLGDDRALFYADDTYPTPSLNANYNSVEVFKSTWSVNKFTNRYSVDPMDGSSCSSSSNQWPDTDLPLMRIAEAYLTYAEAQFRMGNTDVALSVINESIRQRAHATPLTSLSMDNLLDEWLREFYSEGRRRMDLIRFGQFASPSAARTWEGHANITDERFNTFPTPDLLAAYPRFDNRVRYYALLAPREGEPWDPDRGRKCDSCNTGEVYYDAQTNTTYSINQNHYGLGNQGLLQNKIFEVLTEDTLELELAEFPYGQSDFAEPLPAVTPQNDAFTIMVHCNTNCGSSLVVLGDYLNTQGEWIYSRSKPQSHPCSSTTKEQHFAHFEPVGDGWYKAVVYPITEKDDNPSSTLPGYAHITGIALETKGALEPIHVYNVHKVSGIVNAYTESRGEIEFSFSQLATYEDPTYGRLYYSSMLTDRVVYLSAPEIEIPQKPDVPEVAPTANAVTLMIKFDVAPTEGYDILFVGSYGEIDTSWDFATAKKMTAVGDGWYKIVLTPDEGGTITGRPIQWKDGHADWMNDWSHKRGHILSLWNVASHMIVSNGSGEPINLHFTEEDVLDSAVVYLECKEWNKGKFTVTVTLPAFCNEFNVELVGDFNNWGDMPILLERVEGNTYKATFVGSAGDQWTIREAGNWNNQIEYLAGTRFIPPMTFVSEWDILPNQSLDREHDIVLDYSDSTKYRWSICAEE